MNRKPYSKPLVVKQQVLAAVTATVGSKTEM